MIDISANLSEEIDKAKTFAKSENMKCGINEFMIVNVRGDLIDNGTTKSEYAFVELLPITSEPNPQAVGDREGFSYNAQTKAYTAGTGKMLDDGTTPNRVGEMTALKANFTVNRAVAAGNVKKFLLGVFGVTEDQTKPGEIGGAWDDASRQVAGWYVPGWTLQGNVVQAGTPGAKQQFVNLVVGGGTAVPVTKDTPGAKWKDANPLAGLRIKCVTANSPKKTPNEKGAYVAKQNWICLDPLGQGSNTPEACKERFAKHYTQGSMTAAAEDDDGEIPMTPSATPSPSPTPTPTPAPVVEASAAPTPPAAEPTPPAPPTPPAAVVDPNWPPVAPWVWWDTADEATKTWMKKPGFVWNSATNKVLPEAKYRTGIRE